ncbi:hypothetical protein D3C87_1871510 [compost metagenome]
MFSIVLFHHATIAERVVAAVLFKNQKFELNRNAIDFTRGHAVARCSSVKVIDFRTDRGDFA